MGSHRAQSRAPRGRRSVTQETPSHPLSQPGKRAAHKPSRRERKVVEAPRVVEKPAAPSRRTTSGKRSAPRKSLLRGLPSAPIVLGIAALAVSAGGAVSVADPGLVGSASGSTSAKIMQASAVTGASGVARTSMLDKRGPVVSRDSRRDAQSDAAGDDLVAAAEAQVKQRDAALADFAKLAEKQAAKLKLNQWHLPVANYHLTARFGDYGLWSSFHTGLDFAAPSGTPIYAIANGVISSAGYDGSYGNKTVETLDDGTELWYCHQTSFVISSGETVHAGQLIGYIGSTGHVTGPHLHVEVRPGGGDPVDPYQAMIVHGLQP
jgi:murein DD-endopeptidase MepM/ murein hydrolase activator NlpD